MQTDYSKESEIVLHKDYFCGYFECLVQHLFGRIDHHHLRLLLKITENYLLCILLIFPRQVGIVQLIILKALQYLTIQLLLNEQKNYTVEFTFVYQGATKPHECTS